MRRAIILDFDGIVADSEPIHFTMFQRVLGEMGIFLSKEEYYASYLGYDDKGCFEAVLVARDRCPTAHEIERLTARKAALFLEYLKDRLVIYPGVREFVHEAASRYRLAIVSGALRHEIEFVLQHAGIRKAFEHITSAEDVKHGKPDPEGFLHALAALNRNGSNPAGPLRPHDCLVIEDSIPGIQAARAAGMHVMAVTNTHPREELGIADLVTSSLAEISLDDLQTRVWA